MSSEALRNLELALEPVYPSLVLDIEPGKLDVNARVYQGAEPFDQIESVDVTVSVARNLLAKASRLCIDGDEVDELQFATQLEALERGNPYVEPSPPTASVDDVVDFINAELTLADTVCVQIGEARWIVGG